MPLPDFVIIGAQKCGTSSLHNYLDTHPEIGMSGEKELQFFSREDRWSNGPNWYKSRLPATGSLAGESSPQYTWFPWVSEVVPRMHSVIPDARLIYIVRDPIDRLISQYIDWVDLFWEDRDFSVAVAEFGQRPNRYIEPGLYYYQIDQYLDLYSPDHILVVTLEELSADVQTVMSNVFNFLGVDKSFRSDAWFKRSNPRAVKKRPNLIFRRLVGKRLRWELLEPTRLPVPMAAGLKKIIRKTGTEIKPPELGPALENELMDLYREDVRKLRDFTGNKFERWRRY